MDDSDVISFKPHIDNREDDEETLPENNFESSPIRMSRNEGATDRMVAEARLEMRRFLDQCMSDFTKRMQEMLSNFETRLVSTISCKPSENSSRDVVSSSKLSRERDDISNNSNLVDSDRSNGKYELSCKIKPQVYDGNGDLEEYLTQFNLLAELHNWNSKTKALLLASSLSGGARAILNEITEVDRHDFDSLVTSLKNRFGSVNRAEVFRAELQTRVRFKNESLPELAQAIKKLTRRAYPGTSPLVRDTLALDYFIDAIPETEVRLRLREVGPKSINEAENIAVRLEALRVADIQKGRNVRIVDTETIQEHELNREINEIKQSIESLTSEVIIIKNQNGQQFRGDNNYRRNQNNFNRNFNNRGAFRR
ncbi:unnamed protein product [Mytilus coruscus]|uniref:Retrotransposon gag domain-containing protein n=1 Tax=Mytilus coruscus TaxID=42192 RepID=A0A6J8CYG5_MYTCO|nr:unnamed protein product [Mytilus coruscus]